MAFLAFSFFVHYAFHRLVRPTEIPPDVNDVRWRDVLPQLSETGCEWREFRSGTDAGSADGDRRWEPTLAADSLHAAPLSLFVQGPIHTMRASL